MPIPIKTAKESSKNHSQARVILRPTNFLKLLAKFKTFAQINYFLIFTLIIAIATIYYQLTRLKGRYINLPDLALVKQFNHPTSWLNTSYQENGPYFLLVHIIHVIIPNYYALRISSAIFALLGLVICYQLVKLLFGSKISVFSGLTNSL